jgi:hypothetical protein
MELRYVKLIRKIGLSTLGFYEMRRELNVELPPNDIITRSGVLSVAPVQA